MPIDTSKPVDLTFPRTSTSWVNCPNTNVVYPRHCPRPSALIRMRPRFHCRFRFLLFDASLWNPRCSIVVVSCKRKAPVAAYRILSNVNTTMINRKLPPVPKALISIWSIVIDLNHSSLPPLPLPVSQSNHLNRPTRPSRPNSFVRTASPWSVRRRRTKVLNRRSWSIAVIRMTPVPSPTNEWKLTRAALTRRRCSRRPIWSILFSKAPCRSRSLRHTARVRPIPSIRSRRPARRVTRARVERIPWVPVENCWFPRVIHLYMNSECHG